MRSTYLNKAGLNDKQQAALDAIATGPRGAVMGMGGLWCVRSRITRG